MKEEEDMFNQIGYGFRAIAFNAKKTKNKQKHNYGRKYLLVREFMTADDLDIKEQEGWVFISAIVDNGKYGFYFRRR